VPGFLAVSWAGLAGCCPSSRPRPAPPPLDAARRDEEGYCYYLPPDQAGALAQVDLSDDVVVAQLFANGM
jgi:hypothetical protein